MKILLSWLKDYVDITLSPTELEKEFIKLGIEVAEVKTTGADFEGVFAARIDKIERHPNADKLSLVTLATALGAQRVVCGAKNLVEGNIVPLAKVGARLGKNILTAAEIRGVVSEGMICSSDELGLSATRQPGIMNLDKTVPVGADVAAMHGKPDTVFDLEIPSNRPDLLSHLGVARELSILLNLPLKKREVAEVKGSGETLKISLPAGPQGCPRYAGRTIKNIKNAESPAWMKERLLAMGSTPKNALVDITNYVLYDIGHPLHAFDADQLEGGEIIVRFASEGEAFTGLDGVARTLTAQNLVIADGKKPVALAGVLGGAADSISESTKNVFLESAYFYPPAINKTSKQLGISTEASQRFERGVDIAACQSAMALASKLINDLCGGEFSEVRDVYPAPQEPAVVNFKFSDITKILGMEIEPQRLREIFARAAAKFEPAGDGWAFTAPSYRPDISHKWDLAEEAARYYGLDNLAPGDIFATTATLYFGENPKNVDMGEVFVSSLAGLGFYECKNFDFVAERDLKNFGFEPKNVPQIANPLAEGMDFMRPVLLGSLLKNIEYNRRQSRGDLALFEYGKTFALQKGFPTETWALAGAVCGNAPRQKYFGAAQKPVDFFYIKGALQSVLSGFKNVQLKPSQKAPGYMHPKICMDIIIEGKAAGHLGKLHPLTAKAYDIKTDVYVFEFATKLLERQFDAQQFTKAREVGKFPSSKRDLSLVVDAGISYDKVQAALAASAPGAQYSLIDLYQGANLPDGKKSVTLRFDFFSQEKTLTDAEVNSGVETILTALKAQLGAELR